MKSAENDVAVLAQLERAAPQGTTWAVFQVLAVIAHTLLRIEHRIRETPTGGGDPK